MNLHAAQAQPKTAAGAVLANNPHRIVAHKGSLQVREIDVAPDLIHDWDQGMEYAEAQGIERERIFNTERQFLVRYAGCPPLRVCCQDGLLLSCICRLTHDCQQAAPGSVWLMSACSPWQCGM